MKTILALYLYISIYLIIVSHIVHIIEHGYERQFYPTLLVTLSWISEYGVPVPMNTAMHRHGATYQAASADNKHYQHQER